MNRLQNESVNITLTIAEIVLLGCLGVMGSILVLALFWFWVRSIFGGQKYD